MNLYPIFKRELAIKLRELGNPIMDAATNKKNPNFVVFYFEENDKLLKDIKNISKQINK